MLNDENVPERADREARFRAAVQRAIQNTRANIKTETKSIKTATENRLMTKTAIATTVTLIIVAITAVMVITATTAAAKDMATMPSRSS